MTLAEEGRAIKSRIDFKGGTHRESEIG